MNMVSKVPHEAPQHSDDYNTGNKGGASKRSGQDIQYRTSKHRRLKNRWILVLDLGVIDTVLTSTTEL